jgi:hypothetical protein
LQRSKAGSPIKLPEYVPPSLSTLNKARSAIESIQQMTQIRISKNASGAVKQMCEMLIDIL